MKFPPLSGSDFTATRDALHAYAGVLGNWLKRSRPRRKHWWHASLRPSLQGLTTGVVHGMVAVELELNLADSLLEGRSQRGATLAEPLSGQSAAELAIAVARFLGDAGVESHETPAIPQGAAYSYSADQSRAIGSALSAVAGTMARLRALIREETSPIQLWPHHFDLSLLWLPGEKIPGEDPADEEKSDKQMNFGFTLGDAGFADPYFYVTAYPTPPEMSRLPLPAGAHWQTHGFTGAVLPYETLRDPRRSPVRADCAVGCDARRWSRPHAGPNLERNHHA